MLLVTGAAGFIGSNIVRSLNRASRDDLLLVDDLTDGRKCANLSGLAFADYLDRDELLTGIDRLPALTGILHQGACVDTTAGDGRAVMRDNYSFSKTLLDLARRQRCPFIYASSAAVYGDGAAGFREETACERARTPYAFSKWAFDQFVRRLGHAAGVPVVGLRYFNVYGPGEGHKGRMASVAWHCFVAVREGRAPRLFDGSEGFVRDFISVDDVAAVNLHFLAEAAAGRDRSGIYNVGTGLPRSFADMGRIVAEVTGGAAPEVIPFPDDLRGQYQAYTCADLTRLQGAGWSRPFATLEEGIAAYWEAIRDMPAPRP
ncbi:MAG: ADP-glyceromanno-heptose 6-epimerase [Planctomycetia bacterium]|nr:ADP-glyceromanno-heptose 6-epimerase [Planctomycetia bacterium]